VTVFDTHRVITPSRPTPWQGTPVKDQRWTAEQLAALQRAGRDSETIPTAVVHLMPAAGAGFGRAAEVIKLVVPVLIRGRAGKAKIIRPDGSTLWQAVHRG